MGKVGVFGPMVIGQKQYEEEQRQVAVGEPTYGPLVLGTDPNITSGPRPVTSPAEVESPANLDDFRAALFAADQDTADGLMRSEFKRAGGPRKTALKMLLEAEEARPDEGRQPIIDQLEAGIGS